MTRRIMIKRKKRLKNTGLGDGDLGLGLAGLGALVLDSLDDVETFDDLAEDDVLAVEPRGDDGGDEELGAVTVRGLASADGVVGVTVQQAYVLGPALAMERRKGLLWISLKFSSLNFSP